VDSPHMAGWVACIRLTFARPTSVMLTYLVLTSVAVICEEPICEEST
jgi:hypothetical protein